MLMQRPRGRSAVGLSSRSRSVPLGMYSSTSSGSASLVAPSTVTMLGCRRRTIRRISRRKMLLMRADDNRLPTPVPSREPTLPPAWLSVPAPLAIERQPTDAHELQPSPLAPPPLLPPPPLCSSPPPSALSSIAGSCEVAASILTSTVPVLHPSASMTESGSEPSGEATTEPAGLSGEDAPELAPLAVESAESVGTTRLRARCRSLLCSGCRSDGASAPEAFSEEPFWRPPSPPFVADAGSGSFDDAVTVRALDERRTRLSATSVPRKRPRYTAPNVPAPNGTGSPRSSTAVTSDESIIHALSYFCRSRRRRYHAISTHSATPSTPRLTMRPMAHAGNESPESFSTSSHELVPLRPSCVGVTTGTKPSSQTQNSCSIESEQDEWSGQPAGSPHARNGSRSGTPVAIRYTCPSAPARTRCTYTRNRSLVFAEE
mmetsp:Transcript_1972/g.5717  ORF Transcript_1972/g.5717 Transcript_1972/m.5717 type:complete len:432 (-) Transcript_1972:2762-4057(-)